VPTPDRHSAMYGFAIISAGFTIMALLATAAARLSSQSYSTSERKQPAVVARQGR
jgi:hypothetical protein